MATLPWNVRRARLGILAGVAVALLALIAGCSLITPVGPRIAISPPDSAPSTFTVVTDAIDEGGLAAVERRFGKPTASFRMPDTAGGRQEASATYTLPDGRRYVFSWGFDASDTAIVVRHTVLATEGVTLTRDDRSFIAAARDGSSTVSTLDAYLSRISQRQWKPTATRTPVDRDVVYLWRMSDDSGFSVGTVRSNRSLAMARHAGVPYVVWDWPSDHLWSYAPNQ